MNNSWINVMNSTESFLNETLNQPDLIYDENTLTAPLGDEDNNSSLATPIETWIADTTLTSFSFFTAPVMLAVGLFGNVLTLVVTTSGQYKKSAHGLYITAMAIADIVFLTIQPFNRSFAYSLFGKDVRATSMAFCKVYYFILRWARPMSSLVIVLICVERFVVIWFPLKSRIFSNRRVAWIQVVVVFAVSTSVSGFRTLSVGIENDVCLAVAITRYEYNMRLVHLCSVMGMTIRTLVPTLVLLILTPPTVAKLFYQRKIRRRMSVANSNHADETFHVSVMLMSVVVAFCILITPLCLAKHGYLFMGTNIVSTTTDWMRNINEVRLICEQLNCVINFILYVLLSKTFRRQFYSVLTCRRNEKKKWSSDTHSSGRDFGYTVTTTISSKESIKY